MPFSNAHLMSLAGVCRELNAGHLVVLVPLHRPLQPPGRAVTMVPVSNVHRLDDATLLQIDVLGPDRILFVERRDGWAC